MVVTRLQEKKRRAILEMSRLEIMKQFDESSEMWKKNKRSIGNGCYRYICGHICKTEKPCQNRPSKDTIHCHLHQ